MDKTDRVLQLPDGSIDHEAIHGKSTVNLKIGNSTRKIPVYIASVTHCHMLLGTEFLVEHRAEIDLELMTLTIANPKHLESRHIVSQRTLGISGILSRLTAYPAHHIVKTSNVVRIPQVPIPKTIESSCHEVDRS